MNNIDLLKGVDCEMADQSILTRTYRFINNGISELQDANRNPIDGYQDLPLMTLEQSLQELVSDIPNLLTYVASAKTNCNQNTQCLTYDESAAIYLYTMQFSFFDKLNQNLRAKNRSVLKPWFPYLKLFLHALRKLPSLDIIVWRGVTGDISSNFVCNQVQVWWSVNSCSTALDVVEKYVGDRGIVFAIKLIHGKDISLYSAYRDEREIIMLPGTQICVKSNPMNFKNCLSLVHLEEKSMSEFNIQE